MNAMQMQMELGELARGRFDRSVDEFIAARLSEGPTGEDRLMEMICERENMLKALKRVESNAGAPGVDKMKTTQLRGYIRRHWDKIKAALLAPFPRCYPISCSTSSTVSSKSAACASCVTRMTASSMSAAPRRRNG